MKKLLAILAVILISASFAYAQPFDDPSPGGVPSIESPYANQHYFSNLQDWGPRTQWYQNTNYWLDFYHGFAGNPFAWQGETFGLPFTFNNGQLQYGPMPGDESGILFYQMWNSGVKPEEMYNQAQVDPRQDQIDLGYYCDWMDYPEYVGCTSYFYLYVYRPLCVECLCNNWMCLGIYSIPSYWELPGGRNPFVGIEGKRGKYSCIWQLTGQPYWYVVVSGEVKDMNPGDGVNVTWEWFGQNESFLDVFPGTNGFNFTDNFTTLVTLPEPALNDNDEPMKCTSYYFVGVVAKTVSVDQFASCGVKTFEATVSGVYFF